MARPSAAVEKLAREIAKGLPPHQFGGFKGAQAWAVPRSWKNRAVLDRAALHLARERMDKDPAAFPNRMSRQQKRWLRRRGLI